MKKPISLLLSIICLLSCVSLAGCGKKKTTAAGRGFTSVDVYVQ